MPSSPQRSPNEASLPPSKRRLRALALAAAALIALPATSMTLAGGAAPAHAAPTHATPAHAEAPAPAETPTAPSTTTRWQLADTISTIHTGPRAIALSPDANEVIFGYEELGVVNIRNLTTGVTTGIPLDDFAVEPIITVPTTDGYRALVAGTNEIFALGPGGTVEHTADGPGVFAFAFSEHTGTLFSLDGGAQLTERDPVTGEMERWAMLNDFSSALAAHPTKPELYTANYLSGSVSFIDLLELEWGSCACNPVPTVHVTDHLLPSVAVSPDGSLLYALDERGNLFILDTDSAMLLAEIPLHGFFPTHSLAVNPVTGEIVATDLEGRLVFIDPVTFAMTTLELGEGLWQSAISADGERIVVTNTWANRVLVVERVAPLPATNVRAYPGARQAAVFWDPPAAPTVALEATMNMADPATPEYALSIVGDDSHVCITTDPSCVMTDLPVGPIQFVVTATTDAGSAVSEPSEPVIITEPIAPAEPPAATDGTAIAFVGDRPDSATAGQEVEIVVSGFAPSSYVDIYLYSSPQLLATAVVGADGAGTVQATIPVGVAPGPHHLVGVGLAPLGETANAVTAVTIAAAPAPGPGPGPAPDPAPTPPPAPGGDTLPRTGADSAGAVTGALPIAAGALLLLAASTLITARLRRRAASTRYRSNPI